MKGKRNLLEEMKRAEAEARPTPLQAVRKSEPAHSRKSAATQGAPAESGSSEPKTAPASALDELLSRRQTWHPRYVATSYRLLEEQVRAIRWVTDALSDERHRVQPVHLVRFLLSYALEDVLKKLDAPAEIIEENRRVLEHVREL